MKLLLTMSPTVILVVYSQLATKWRVGTLFGDTVPAVDALSRLLIYLKDPYIVSAYFASFIASITWMFVVENHAISKAFPIYIGSVILLVTIGGLLIFREPISPQRMASIALIILGVILGSNA
jgi:multidrug transporter EmrE-like cation transporter